MKLLLDTNILVRHADGKLPRSIQRLLEKPSAELYVSIITLWEIAMKPALHRFSTDRVLEHLERIGARILPVTVAHTRVLYSLPMHHDEPFDRMIIAQALEEQCPVVSSDQRFPLYESVGLQVIWD